MTEEIQAFEKDWIQKIELAGSFKSGSGLCMAMAIMYCAYGIMYLGIERFWIATYCFKQAARSAVISVMLDAKSKEIGESEQTFIGVKVNAERF